MNTLLRRRSMIANSGSSPTPPEPPTPTSPVFYDKLIFDGTAYIDTTIVPPTDASIRVRLGNETTKGEQRCFFAQGASSTFMAMIYNTNTTSSTRKFSIYYGSSTAKSTTQTLAFSTTTYGFYMTPKRFGWGSSTSYTYTKGSDTPSGGLIFGSNASHSGNPYTGSMETITVYADDAQNVTSFSGFESYTPSYTLRPCTYNGVAGLWCVETSSFFGNTAGAGTLSVANNS